MDTFTAFGKGKANRGKELMVFDWEKAAQMIAKAKPQSASARLSGDWRWTGGKIYENGAPVSKDSTYTYLASTWATPELEIDGVVHDCFKMQSETPGWDSETFWPIEAVAALNPQ